MSTMLDEYKQQYETVFQGDIGFSRKFMPQIQAVLDSITLPKKIRNNEGTELDKQGSDLTVMPLQIGVRVRRNYARRWDQFTQDDKERQQMSCDVYFLGYANPEETQLVSYMIWNGGEYEQLRDTSAIPMRERIQNFDHSLVYFNCYSNQDIAENCTIYALEGRIAGQNNGGQQCLF
jgi:hypothetical protein